MPKVKTLQKHMKMLFTKQPFMKKTTVCLMNIGMTDIRQRKKTRAGIFKLYGLFYINSFIYKKINLYYNHYYKYVPFTHICFSEIFSYQR